MSNDTARIAILEARVAELLAATATLSTTTHQLADATDTSWVLNAAALVILMQQGFAMLEAGTVRAHNVIATYAKNILDFVLGTIVASTFGYWISYDGALLRLDLMTSELCSPHHPPLSHQM